MLATGTAHFINNSAVAAGGALTGSSQSYINISCESVIFLNNTADMVLFMCLCARVDFIIVDMYVCIHECMWLCMYMCT